MKRRLSYVMVLGLGLAGCKSAEIDYVPEEKPVIPTAGIDDQQGGVFGVSVKFGARAKKNPPAELPKKKESPRD